MPYPAYTKMSDDDVLTIRAYLGTVAPVRNEVNPNRLPFPFNIRLVMVFWNARSASRRVVTNRNPQNLRNGIAAPMWSKVQLIAAPVTHQRRCSAPTRPTALWRGRRCRAGLRLTSPTIRTRASARGRRMNGTVSQNRREQADAGHRADGRGGHPFDLKDDGRGRLGHCDLSEGRG
jgi:hypothetical protein